MRVDVDDLVVVIPVSLLRKRIEHSLDVVVDVSSRALPLSRLGFVAYEVEGHVQVALSW